jgi:GNAT superfamily N-acetyltransferase
MNTTHPNITIRRATSDDLESILPLAEQLGYPTSPEAMIARLTSILADPMRVIFVADPGDGIAAGYIQASRHVSLEVDPLVEIDGLVVSRDHRRQGIGKMLIAAVEEWARSLGILTVRLHTNIIREEAHRFYKDLGFTINKTQYSMVKKLIE